MKHLKKFNYALFESKKNKETIKSEIEEDFLNLMDKGAHEVRFFEKYYMYINSKEGVSFKREKWGNRKFSQNKKNLNEVYLTDKQFNKLNQLQDGYYPLYHFFLSIDKFSPMQSILKNFERLDSDDNIFIFEIKIKVNCEMTTDYEFQEETNLEFCVAELSGRVDSLEDLPEEFGDDDDWKEEYEPEEDEEEY